MNHAMAIHSALIKRENLMRRHHIALHSGYLCDVRDATPAIAQAAYLDDQVDGAGYLLFDGLIRQVRRSPQHHAFEPRYRIPRGIGMNGGK
jgi:hypothetical protein